MKKNKLLLIGWDAGDWEVIAPLIGKGLMPSLKKLINEGVYGNMSTMNPPYSPMLWSSVATGKTPDKHGVLGFVEVTPDNTGIRPVTVNSRKSRAIWNILHHKGLKSNLVGWWPSFPAEPINGVVVSDKFQKIGKDFSKPTAIAKGAVHPEHYVQELKHMRMFPHELTKEHILPFMPKAGQINQETEGNRLNQFAKIMAENVSVHNAATFLASETEWDFMAVYHDYIDHMCHGFMKYHPPRLKQVPEKDYEIYKDIINSAYRFQDMMLGRMLELVDDDTTVIVMSDHGFESGNKRILKMPKVTAAPALDHRQFGMFVAKGPNIRKNEKVYGLSLIDIAPTILHHFNLPVGKDMDGKIALDIFQEKLEPTYVESWEDIEGDFGQLQNANEESWTDAETMEQLIELGYIDRPDEKIENSILKTKCDLKQNLAKVYLGKKDFLSAKELLLELIKEKDPIDTSLFYFDLLNVCVELKEFEEAARHIEEFKKVKTDVVYNVYFIESEIEKGRGNIQKACEILENVPEHRLNAEVFFRLGVLYFMKGEYETSKGYYDRAIDKEPSKAKYHKAMAKVLYELENYEEAAESAFTSIELIKYFPDAHYILGRALEKMGDLKNAKMAYETAERLKPRAYDRARIARENIEEVLSQGKTHEEQTKEYKFRDKQIVIVSGLPRSGTSLMMQMLSKGGSPILTDENRKADISNPKGYYEYDPVMSIHKDNSWLEKAQNKSVKIVAPLLKFLDPEYRYKIIFMTRDLNEVVKSQQVMRGKDPETLPLSLLDSFKKLLHNVAKWKDREPGVEMIYVNYKDAIENPKTVVDRVTKFVGKDDFNKQAMIDCVDMKLYRNK